MTKRMYEKMCEAECIQCEEVITNPICPNCLANKMRQWLAEVNPELVDTAEGFEMEGDVRCIFCGNTMSICAHCYSKDVYEAIAEKDEKTAQEFLSRFDFDLRKEMV